MFVLVLRPCGPSCALPIVGSSFRTFVTNERRPDAQTSEEERCSSKQTTSKPVDFVAQILDAASQYFVFGALLAHPADFFCVHSRRCAATPQASTHSRQQDTEWAADLPQSGGQGGEEVVRSSARQKGTSWSKVGGPSGPSPCVWPLAALGTIWTLQRFCGLSGSECVQRVIVR